MNKNLIIKILIAVALVGTIISHFCKYTEAAAGYTHELHYPTNYNAVVYGDWKVNLDSIQKEYEYTDTNGDWYISAKGDVIDGDNFVMTWYVQNYDEDGNIYQAKGLLVRLFLTDGSVKTIELPDGDINDFRVAYSIVSHFQGNHKMWK